MFDDNGRETTDTAWNAIEEAAAALGISSHELIERLGRKGVDWLKEEAEDDATVKNIDIPDRTQIRIKEEYGKVLQEVLTIGGRTNISVAIYVVPPNVWLYFNKVGQSEVKSAPPMNPEDCVQLKKDEDIWSYSNINAYLDGCKLAAEMYGFAQPQVET